MVEKLTQTAARYEQVFFVSNFDVEPQLLGVDHVFSYEQYTATLSLPPLSNPDLPPIHPSQMTFDRAAEVFYRGSNGEPRGVNIAAIKLILSPVSILISEAAASYAGINSSLHDKSTQDSLDVIADELRLISERALEFWFRILWWKTGAHSIGLSRETSSYASDGGVIVNSGRSTRVWTPLASRTISLPSNPLISMLQWSSVEVCLRAAKEPPVWYEYITSSDHHLTRGNQTSALLDLAIAVEAVFRSCLERKYPDNLLKGFKNALDRVNSNDVLTRWKDYGLPSFDKLEMIRKLFKFRNEIMHRGSCELLPHSVMRELSVCVRDMVSAFDNDLDSET